MNIVIKDLCKIYRGKTKAIKGLSLDIGPGMFGLLGPNGAGKTTLMRILATLVRPSSGTARVGGYLVNDPYEKWQIKAILGYLPQELVLYGNLSAYEFLDFVAVLKLVSDSKERNQEVERVLELTGLQTVAKQLIRTYSGGMKRRVGIAQALLGDPKVLIVDEPTAGLDPQERVRFRNLLVRLANERLVLLSTHIVEDIAQTCLHTAVMHQGELLFHGAVTELIDQARSKVWIVEARDFQLKPDMVLATSTPTTKGIKHRVLADEQPHPDAWLAEPEIEEGYLWLMNRAGHHVGNLSSVQI